MPLNLQQNGSGAARNVVLVIVLVASIALVSVYTGEGQSGPIHSVQNALAGPSAQLGSAGAGLGATGEGAATAVSDATASESTLSALREQNQELRQLLAAAEEYRQEAERLQALLDMKVVSGVSGPVANIIGRSANAWDRSITIDLGAADGVEAGMTVMGATGVIGQVARTADHTSTVRLLTDPNSGAAVMIQSSREDGIVRGSINGILYLEDLDEDVIPEVGDVIITSGLGGSYERGLIVGAVVSVNKSANNPTGTIVVSPNDSAALLEEVIVVFSAPNATAEEETAARAALEAAAAANGRASDYEDGDGEDGEDGEGADEGEGA